MNIIINIIINIIKLANKIKKARSPTNVWLLAMLWCVWVVDLSRYDILNVGAARVYGNEDGTLFPGVK